MHEFLIESVYFGVLLSLSAYGLGMFIKKKLKLAFFNPTLISVGLIIALLLYWILITKPITRALSISVIC